MNLKKLIVSQAKKAAINEAANKILPMDSNLPKKFGKGKAAALLGILAAIAAAVPAFIK